MFSTNTKDLTDARFVNHYNFDSFYNFNITNAPFYSGSRPRGFFNGIQMEEGEVEGHYVDPSPSIIDETGLEVASEWSGATQETEPNIGALESIDTLGPSVAISMASSQLGKIQTDQLLQKDYTGQGAAGHSFAIGAQEKSDSLFEEQQTLIRGGLIGVGSLFGPEGLAIGTAAAGIESAMFSPPTAQVPAEGGMDIPATNVL